MASADRKASDDLIEALREKPDEYGFLFALRLIEAVYADAPGLGRSLKSADDPVRLAHEPSLAFETSTISSYESGKAGARARLVSRFLGLFGPNGPLPLHLTEYARDRMRHHQDETFARFADIFHHRMLSLFYRAWADAEPTVHRDRPGDDRFAAYVGSLLGIGMPSLQHRDEVADDAKRYYAGLFACQARNPEGLQKILSDYFKQSVIVREFVGEWLDLSENWRCRLDSSRAAGALAKSAILGSHVWSCQHKFRLVIGPLTLSDYLEFLPKGKALAQLRTLIRNYLGDEMTWDAQLELERDEVPPLKLDARGMLGWTSWLGHRESRRNADDLILSPASSVI